MAKNPQKPEAGTSGKITVTYKGIHDSIDYLGYHMPKGKAVEVDEQSARRVMGNSFFDVTGVSEEKPTFDSAEEAIEAERAKHKAEIEELTRLHAEEMERSAESLKAGWKEQHDELVAENERLKAQLAGPDA